MNITDTQYFIMGIGSGIFNILAGLYLIYTGQYNGAFIFILLGIAMITISLLLALGGDHE